MTAYTREKMSRVVIALSAIALASTHVASAQQVSPAEHFQKIIDLSIPVDEAINAQKSGHTVIVVFDIDNTLLTMPQDLGGDTWFNWKKSEISKDPQNQEPLDTFFSENSLLLQAGSMKPTQENTAALIRELQDNGVAVYALSARGDDLRGTTELALKSAGIDLSTEPECGPPLCSRRGNLNDAQIRDAAHALGMNLPPKRFRPVTVSDGVMMIAGQNKGVMLPLLIESLSGTKFTDVYFVDDTLKNIEDVDANEVNIYRIHLFNYRKFWGDADRFNHDSTRQEQTEKSLGRLREALCSAMKSALCPKPNASQPD